MCVSRPDTCPDPRPCCGTTSEPAIPQAARHCFGSPTRARRRPLFGSPPPSSIFLVLGASESLQYHPSPVVNATPGRRRGPWLNAKILRRVSTPIYPGRALTRFGPALAPAPAASCWGHTLTDYLGAADHPQSRLENKAGQEQGGRTDRTVLARLVQIVLCLITAYWSTVDRA